MFACFLIICIYWVFGLGFIIVAYRNTSVFLLLSRILFCGQVTVCSYGNDHEACCQLKAISEPTKSIGVQFFGKYILLILVTSMKVTFTFKKNYKTCLN